MAVKVLHRRLAEDPEMEARARDEARVMSLLNHDHVLKIHALTEMGGRSAVLMEYIEGIDVEALIEASREAGDGGLPLTVAGAIVERAASALHAAWSSPSPQGDRALNIVHRDIKPSNLLISVSGVVKVLDFGVARGDYERESHTREVQVAAQMGTRRYMSPERWLEQRCDAAADVYALGVSLCEMLTAEKFDPFPLEEKLYAQRIDEVVAGLEVVGHPPETQRRLAHIVRRMMAWDPDDRPTAAQVDVLVSELLVGVEGPSLRRYAREVVPMLLEAQYRRLTGDNELHDMTNSLVSAAPRPGSEATIARTAPSPPALAVALGAAAVVLVGLGSLWWFEAGKEPGIPPDPAPPVPAVQANTPEPLTPEPLTPEPAQLEPAAPVEQPPSVSPKPEKVEPKPAQREEPLPPVAVEGPPVVVTPPASPPAPVVKPAASVDAAPLKSGERGRRGDRQSSVIEPAPAPAVETQPAKPPASSATTSVKLLSDPVAEKILLNGVEYHNGDVVELKPGRYDLIYFLQLSGDDKVKDYICTVSVDPGQNRIKFSKEEKSCKSYSYP